MIAFNIEQAGLIALCCPECQVTWKGLAQDTCWSCDGPSSERWSPSGWMIPQLVNEYNSALAR